MTDSIQSSIRCVSLEFNLELGTITNSRSEIQRLSPINLKLIAYFLMYQSQVISRTELFDAIWPNQIISDDVLTRAVSDIRTQLAKLDSDTKFIETLPKRGYRWVAEVSSVMSLEMIQADIGLADVTPDVQPSVFVSTKNWIKSLIIYFSLAVVLTLLFMLALSQFLSPQTLGVAVLPSVADRPAIESLAKTVDEALLNALRKNTKIKLLSASVIKSRPQNPFPYFANEFGAAWVIESRVSNLDDINSIELSLVDARTGIELRNLSFDVDNRADVFHKIAQKLESDFLVEKLPY